MQAISPLGDASTASLRGTGSFNGGAIQNNFNANFASQETLTTLSSDTGGKAFLDSNDFAPAFAQIQRDSSAYYVIGFHPSNPARDGRYRKLQVKVKRPGVKLEYRQGYYAPSDFQHSGKEDRERELDEQLASDLPATDVALYLDAFYFRLDEGRFYVPVSLIVPGSQIPFSKGGDRDKATLDVLGEVIDEAKRPIGHVRETVKLAVDAQQQVRQKNVQYSTSFNLPPGKYHLKFVVRENQSGHMGSFETDIVLPDMRKSPMKLSSILLASMRVPTKATNPLVREGQQYVPNISHVFRQGQHLYLLYEVYSPAKVKPDTAGGTKVAKGAISLVSSLELIQGSTKVFRNANRAGNGGECGGAGCGRCRTGRAPRQAEAGLLRWAVERSWMTRVEALPSHGLRCWCGKLISPQQLLLPPLRSRSLQRFRFALEAVWAMAAAGAAA